MKETNNNDRLKRGEISISIWLRRAEAKKFLRYQEQQKLRNKSEAARKLLLERLDEVGA